RVTHGEQIPHQFQRAVAAAVQGRPGPVHLTITDNAFDEEIPADTYLDKLSPQASRVEPQGWGDPQLIESAAELIKGAKRPLLIAGSGLFYSHGVEALAEFARRTDIPILTPMWDRGPVEEPLRQYIGITDPEANPAYKFLGQCDLLINVGARFDYRLNYLQDCPQDMKIIHIHDDALELNRGYLADVAILGSPAAVMEQLTAALPEEPAHSQWLEEIIAYRAQALDKWFSMKDDDRMPMRAARLVLELAPFLEDDKTVLVIDGGNIGRWAQMLLFNRCRGKWITCGTSGVIGHGIPIAMAAKLAFPDHKVLLLTGDGSFGFTPLELWNAQKKNLPFTAVIAADGAWGIVADKQPPHARYATEFGPIPFYALAEALQAKGVLIERPEEIKDAVATGLASDRVTVIQVPCQQGGIDVIAQDLLD
ncbi:MAG: thiamine pyrophosphate-binding protein, partial [Limnochordia bacterium]